MKKQPRPQLTHTQIEDISLQFVITHLLEFALRQNYDLLSSVKKAEFGQLLTRLKWLNKETERKCSDQVEDDLYNDATQLYRLIRALIKATKQGRDDEFIRYVESFSQADAILIVPKTIK